MYWTMDKEATFLIDEEPMPQVQWAQTTSQSLLGSTLETGVSDWDIAEKNISLPRAPWVINQARICTKSSLNRDLSF